MDPMHVLLSRPVFEQVSAKQTDVYAHPRMRQLVWIRYWWYWIPCFDVACCTLPQEASCVISYSSQDDRQYGRCE